MRTLIFFTFLTMALNIYAEDEERDDSYVIQEKVVGNVKVTAKAKKENFASEQRKRYKSQGADTNKEKREDTVSITFTWPAKK